MIYKFAVVKAYKISIDTSNLRVNCQEMLIQKEVS